MATVYDTALTTAFGITSDETANGLFMQSLSLNASLQEAFLSDHQGDDLAVALHNESATLTARGFLAVTNSLALTQLGKAPTVANSAMYGTETAVTEFWIPSLDLEYTNRDFQQGGWTANGRVGITSITASS